MARRTPPRKVTYFEPVPPCLAHNTIIESIFEVGRRFSCTMRVECGQLDPGVVIRPIPGEWRPRMPERLDEEGACGLARWPQCNLSARRADNRRAPRGRRPISRASRTTGKLRPAGSRLRTNGYNPDSIFPDSRTSFETNRRSA